MIAGYKPYDKPKQGLFSIHPEGARYSFPQGWETKIEELTIIGEDKTAYIYRLQPAEHGEWVGRKVVKKKYILPIGVHKSRLIRWKTKQLELFE